MFMRNPVGKYHVQVRGLFLALRKSKWRLIATTWHKVFDWDAAMRDYEVATFYTMLMRNPVGKYHVQVRGFIFSIENVNKMAANCHHVAQGD
jgi:hypothetical protein